MLEAQRHRLDVIDRQIVTLFEQRMIVAQEIAKIKQAEQLEITDAQRESQVLDRVGALVSQSEWEPLVKELYVELMRLSRQVQLMWWDSHPDGE